MTLADVRPKPPWARGRCAMARAVAGKASRRNRRWRQCWILISKGPPAFYNKLRLPPKQIWVLVRIRFSREHLRRVLRKKHLQNYVSSTSSHLHLCTSTFSPISLLMFTPAHLHLCSSSNVHIYISAHLHLHISTSVLMFASAHLHLSAHLQILTSSLLILTSSHLLLTSSEHHECGDRACRVREIQARVPFGFVRRDPLRRSCVSSA